MFNKLIKGDNGKTTSKILATLLVITLTFANFALLGSYLGKAFFTYATETNLNNQNNSTNIENVKFDVYLDETDRNKKQISKNINAEDLNLFVSLSVQGGGKLKNPKIDFSNSNFELKDNNGIFEKNFDAISSENGVNIALPIVARKNSNYDLSLLNMVSNIHLSGEYVDENGNVTQVDSTKEININWMTDEIKEEQIVLSQELITNKTYNIEGINKKIVQLLVKTNVEGNIAPVKTTKVEVQVPQIGVKPEKVKVTAKNTLATNGKTDIEFGNIENSKYEYNEEEGKIYIEVLNNADINNTISWQKNVSDEFIVTYLYDEKTEVVPFISKAKSTLEIYGRTNGILEKENELQLDNLETTGDIATLESGITDKIYKGNMYIGEDSNYTTKNNIFVSYTELAKKITFQDLGDTIDIDNLSTYYKNTKINKAEALNVLGKDGTIKIYNVQDLENPIEEIDLSKEIEGEYITVNYKENINKIMIETSQAINEGNLEIINEKAIKVLNLDKIENATKLDTGVKLTTTDAENKITADLNKTLTSNLVEPATTIDMVLDKNFISNQVENTLRLTSTLKTADSSNKLFKNPIINVEFPKEITEVNIENIALLYGEELKLKSSEVTKNDNGNNVLKIEVEGEQTKYNTNSSLGGTNIVIDLKVLANAFMANKNVEIKTTCINNGENAEKTNKIAIIAKSGLVTKSVIKTEENEIEEINQNNININVKENEEVGIDTSIINNYGKNLSNVNIIATIPEEATLKTQATTNNTNATVYYSEETNPAVNSESWKTEVPENLESIKAFKIMVSNISQEELITLNYKLNQRTTDAKESIIRITGIVDGQNKEETLKYVINTEGLGQNQKPVETGVTKTTDKLSIEVIPTIGGQEATSITEINNGQTIRYKIRVTNISNEPINNLKIKSTIQNAVFYELAEDGGGYLDIETDEMVKTHKYQEIEGINNKEFTNDMLASGETCETEYQVVAYIGSGENANSFKNDILIIADDMDEIATQDLKTIKQAQIALKLHYSSNEEPELYSNGDLKVFEIDLTNLTESKLENVPISINLPNEFMCDVNDQECFDATIASINAEDNKININVNNLEANETKNIFVQLKTKSIPLDQIKTEIMLVATANYNGTTYSSNEYIRNMLQTETSLNAEFTSDKIDQTLYLNSSDNVITYTLTLTNTGVIDTGTLYIFDEIPYDLYVTSITAQINDQEGKEYTTDEDGNIYIDDLSLGVNESLRLTITAELDSVDEDNPNITNKISISGLSVGQIEKELINATKIDLEEPDEPDEPEDPTDPEDPEDPTDPTDPEDPENPTDPDNPEDPTDPTDPDDSSEDKETYSISGLAWLDENKNGIKENNEEILQGIKVILIDQSGSAVKDKDGNEISTVTGLTGTYKFNDIAKGEYVVVFIYDTEKYTVSKYQIEGASEEENSDVISKQLTIDGQSKLVGVTDTIKIEDNDIKNIDMGLIQNAKFDLSLEKYVSKVIVTNNSENATYDFGEETLAKVEIAAKKLNSSSIIVQYDIKISNDGDVQGYVSDVIDYLPKELTFDSGINADWYLDSNGALHNTSLSNTAIEPGKTKTLSLVLIKTLNSNSTGTIDNIAEIGTSSNLEGIQDIDSVGANMGAMEDDIGNASLIISIKTGSPVMYIGIVIASMAVISLGIFIINKKILGNKI